RIRRLRRGRLVPHVDQVAVGITHPETALGRAPWGVHLAHAGLLQRGADANEVLARGAEAQMMEPLSRPLVEEHRRAGLALRAEADRVGASARVDQPEVLVVALADRLIGDLERVAQQRTHRHGYASFTVFSSVPRPVISRRTVSPGWSVTCGLREK